MTEKFKQTICIDFDGVIHSYENGWQEGKIYGSIVPGFFEWAEEAAKIFNLAIYSSRSKKPEMIEAMETWLESEFAQIFGDGTVDTENRIQEMLCWFDFASEKPPAWVTIDDRCIRFDGDWKALSLRPEAILAYQPWNTLKNPHE